MPCYNPVRAWYSNTVNETTGKRQLTFSRSSANTDMELSLPCGKCMGCRIMYAMEWSLRCMHEAQLHENNCFITLTYDPEHLPQDGSLNKRDFQLFMKRLRKQIAPTKVRYYMCGEYGDQLSRPHYHILLFGYDFPDKQKFKYRSKSVLYTSSQLEELWPYGFSTIGALTRETAQYVAKYATKKINGKMADEHYQGKMPEFALMSNRPGIGKQYVDKYKKELFQHDTVVSNGMELPVPNYYYKQMSAEEQQDLKDRHVKKARANKQNNTIERLRVREKVKQSKVKLYDQGRNLSAG